AAEIHHAEINRISIGVTGDRIGAQQSGAVEDGDLRGECAEGIALKRNTDCVHAAAESNAQRTICGAVASRGPEQRVTGRLIANPAAGRSAWANDCSDAVRSGKSDVANETVVGCYAER